MLKSGIYRSRIGDGPVQIKIAQELKVSKQFSLRYDSKIKVVSPQQGNKARELENIYVKLRLICMIIFLRVKMDGSYLCPQKSVLNLPVKISNSKS